MRAWKPHPSPPNDSFQASLSPPVGGCLRSFRRDWLTNKCSDVKHYHQWLHSSIHLKTKFSQSTSDSVMLQGPSKRTSSDLLYPVSSVKERNRKGGKCKFYCVNTSYPMDNSLSGRRGPARQTPEKDVLCLHRLGRPSTVHSPDGVSYFLPV